MKIQQILDKIDDNQLFVPAFQREYVWKRENAKELIICSDPLELDTRQSESQEVY